MKAINLQNATNQKSSFDPFFDLFDTHNYYGILLDCPAENRLNSCPIKAKEHLSFKDKIKWYDNLSSVQKHRIVSHHLACSKKQWKNGCLEMSVRELCAV